MATWKHSTRIDSSCCGDIFIGRFVSLLIKKYQQDKKYMLDTCWQISSRFQMFIIFFEHESPQDKSPAGDQLWNSGRQYWIFSHIGNREGVILDSGYCSKIMLFWKQICCWCLDTKQNAWYKCKCIHRVINSELDQCLYLCICCS